MPAVGAAYNNPSPGTQKLTQPEIERRLALIQKPKGILKGIDGDLTEEEELRRNTDSNKRKRTEVGYVASTISREYSKLKTGSAYGLTEVASNIRNNPNHYREGRDKTTKEEPDEEINQLLQRADKLRREQQNNTSCYHSIVFQSRTTHRYLLKCNRQTSRKFGRQPKPPWPN